MRASALLTGLVPTILIAAGCGDSGASRIPTVTVKRAEKADEGATGGAAANGGGTTTTNGAETAVAGGFGTFSGRVVLTGTPPETRILYKKGDATAKDAAVCAAMDLPDESLVVSADGGVANVFVFLQKAPKGGKAEPVPTEKEPFDQKYCRFIPHSLAVRAGQTINVLNDDNVLHNTHLFPQKGANQAANSNFALQPNDRVGLDYVYKVAETVPVQVKCDIHSWMIAWHLPLDHQYFAVTDENGRFEIKDLPAGAHEFVIWQEKAGRLDAKYKVTIEADKATEKEIAYPVASFASFKGPPPKVVRLTAMTDR